MSADPRQALTSTAVTDESPEVGRGELGSLLRAPSSRARGSGAAATLGRIVAVEAGGAVSVEIPGAPGARTARLAAPLSQDELLAARETGGSAVLVFENGDAALPIIVGLLQAASPAHAAPAPAGVPDNASSDIPPALEATVDGKRVRITAQDEIVLECGSASITLRRNGRVVVRGTYVESYSDGTNRIKGGQVRIN
ncbi:MAG TPA: DUF6484 domain-containing protein [Steroidobacteraceae bacterium]